MQKTRAPLESAGQDTSKTLIKSGGPLHIRSLSTAYDQLSAKKLFVMKFLNSPASLLNGCHLNERKALGALCILVTDNLSIPNLAYTVKQFEKVAFRSIER
ncbi:MAG TPA: hypothetical protein VK692_04980 [Chthoniobacterales bacterium]|jgi:hypothetical protein|nr:hypothetical protein [Chthoniobacterales bacterium]